MASTTKTWQNNQAPTVEDVDLNGFKEENNNLIVGSGQVLNTGDRQQTHKAVANYSANGDFYTDGGSTNQFVLTSIGTHVPPTAYFDGMRVRFVPNSVTTGAATVNVAGLGVKNIVNWTPLLSDNTDVIELTYNLADDDFRLTSQRTFNVANYAELRAIPSAQFVDGDKVWVKGYSYPWEIKTGTVTDNNGALIVFTDNPNRYAETTLVNLDAGLWPITQAGAQAAIDYFAVTAKYKKLDWPAVEYPASGTPIQINAVGKSMEFHATKFNDDIYFYRCLVCTYTGYFETTADARFIGQLDSIMPSFRCDFFYLQNYAGWGGVNFVDFGWVRCNGGQIRQAALSAGGPSSINEVSFQALYCQGGSDNNVWNNFGRNLWIRSGESNQAGAPVYTEDGTAPSLTGLNKWENSTTVSPFTIYHGDMSYIDNYSTPPTESCGIYNESSRPLSVHSMFIEGHDADIIGPCLTYNYEARNAGPRNFTPEFSRDTATSNTQKWGNYKKTIEPIFSNYEFKKGFDGIDFSFIGTGGGITDIASFVGTTESTSDYFIKVVNTGPAGGAYASYSFTAQKTGRIQVAVRGSRLGQIAIKNGGNPTQFGLGYTTDDTDEEYYSIASTDVNEGNTVQVFVYTKGFSTPNTGDVTSITGFGVLYGSHAPTLYQESDQSFYKSTASTTTTATIATLTGLNYGISCIKFEFGAFLTGQGFITGCFEAVVKNDGSAKYDAAASTILYSTSGSLNGGSTDVDITLAVGASESVDIQINKNFFGTNLDQITIKKLELSGTMSFAVV